MSSLRPSLRPTHSSPNNSGNSVPMAKQNSQDTSNPNPAAARSIQFSERPSMPSAMSSSGVGFPRTSTKDSQDGGKYRRKVGFEAFEAGPEALFAYTCQVSDYEQRGDRLYLLISSGKV
jgi:hypothetical protein